MTEHDPSTPLDSVLQALPREVAPPRDLWPDIAARIEAERVEGRARAPMSGKSTRPRWMMPLLGAAAAIALVATSSLITAALLGSGRQSATMATTPPPPRAADPATDQKMVPAAFGPGYVLDHEYLAARGQLASTLQTRIAQMPPSTRQKLEANLAELHRATREINAALAQQPGDPLLEELLLSTYQDELAVLASVNLLTSNPAERSGTHEDGKRIAL
jgi:hypothetical protein